MPQMFPTMWLLLYTFFIIILLIMTTKIYSLHMPTKILQNFNNTMPTKKKNWMW
uniref:ATP synthase F0 subunit 8 n=1 Tax=Neelides sp. FZ-2019 TaxID=2583951 RepID=A0A6H0EXZ8_9HEXA|nr:ATP synthase F0 subunit 8 [Neelides sp. FZ-2019]